VRRRSVLRVIFVTGHGDIPMSVRAIKSGADDLLSKPVSTAALKESVQRALERFDATHERQVQLNGMRTLLATLTAREREVFDLFVRGKLNKEIAYQLATSERTIKAHRHSVMQKLSVNSVTEAVSVAERLGMLASTSEMQNSSG
jgi:RNA polymerase sigma factor (sigma-70 family)